MNHQAIIDHTRRWISSIVIGLDLCPFARRVFDAERIRYVVTDAESESALAKTLADELSLLAASEQVETTVLIHPGVLADFLDYNDFLDTADRLIESLDLDGIIQIASFHPHYQFADTDPTAVENYTNRSPYPMLHLLREASVSAIADDLESLEAIPRRNIETLRSLGLVEILARLKTIEHGT